jgi:CDP-diacylglycerol--glycerol-3-phosphate 3-phosphatidyltransferase
MANLITIVRFPLILIYLIILYFWRSSSAALAWNVPLVLLIFILDVIDGWVARKRGEASMLGSVLDIATDRTLEYILWIVYAHLLLIPVAVPLIVITRGVTVDAVRAVGMKSGSSAFEQVKSPLSRFLVGSRFMRGFYGTVKAAAAAFLTLKILLDSLNSSWSEPIWAVALVFTWISVITCLLRGVPVIIEGFQSFSGEGKSNQ